MPFPHGPPPVGQQLLHSACEFALLPQVRTQFQQIRIVRHAVQRLFKQSTGTTFRQFKRWTGLQHAARLIVAGALVRTAAMDAGFADTAHLTRTFKQCFGLTPSQAIAGMPTIGAG